MTNLVWTLLFWTFLHTNYVTTQILDMLEFTYKTYKEKRIHFREDPVLGNLPILNEYDFVIIGSGAGGSTVATRLSEIPDWKILVLEAGKDGSIYLDIPAPVGYLQFTDYNWGFRYEKQEGMCLGIKDQRCPLPRGKGMGGSTLINYMMYVRGRPADYDGYEANGNIGWGYKDVLPYFLKSERCRIPELTNSSYHSNEGYLDVELNPFKTKLIDVFIDGFKELGYHEIDYNSGEEHEGVSRLQSTTRAGRRVSAAKAYLEKGKDRQNLHVVEKARVTKILIDPKTKRALGVEFVKNKTKRVVYADKEVILSAGTINSPQILMLSGIGPKNHLQDLGIPLIQDLPVGENLHDHFITTTMLFTINVSWSLNEKNILNSITIEMEKWLRNGKSVLSLPGGIEGVGFLSSKHNKDQNFPDLELIFISGSVVSDGGGINRKILGMTEDFYNTVYKSIDYQDSITICPMVLRPKSRGRIKLQSKNPWQWPLLDLNYFENPADLDVIVEGMKKIVKLGETDAFRSINATLHTIPFPSCSNLTFGTDDYWACAARTLTSSLHHPCGTCKMGPASDFTSVVDPRLRVHGVDGLRVVDASIFPQIPSGHLYAPTVVVGEKAAEMIKQEWSALTECVACASEEK